MRRDARHEDVTKRESRSKRGTPLSFALTLPWASSVNGRRNFSLTPLYYKSFYRRARLWWHCVEGHSDSSDIFSNFWNIEPCVIQWHIFLLTVSELSRNSWTRIQQETYEYDSINEAWPRSTENEGKTRYWLRADTHRSIRSSDVAIRVLHVWCPQTLRDFGPDPTLKLRERTNLGHSLRYFGWGVIYSSAGGTGFKVRYMNVADLSPILTLWMFSMSSSRFADSLFDERSWEQRHPTVFGGPWDNQKST